MKICLTNAKGSWKNSHSGKGHFASRLVPALQRLDIEVTQDTRCRVDIDLQFGKYHYEPKNCRKSIVRLGPAHVDTMEKYKLCNARKWKSVKRADGVIYQSRYSRKVCRTFLGKPKCPEVIIPNGAPRCHIDPSTDGWITFLASTRKWLPQKRLKSIVKAFHMAEVPNSQLVVCGNTLGKYPEKGNIAHVRFLGNVEDEFKLEHIYARANALIHIVYLDACPNSVVEALVAGCPVITTDQGGTHELLTSDVPHIILKDKPYKFNPINLQKPPKIDVELLAKAMLAMACPRFDGWAKHLEIGEIAKRYVRFFEEVL